VIRTESGCVDCGLPCLYEACPNYQVFVYECDCCGDEANSIYYFDGQELCIDCIENRLERVEYNG
jgi:hypothetical protein